jgi:hypothetical protein
MTFRILEDGTVRTLVDGISGVNHASADALVKGIDGLLAGRVDVQRRGDAHAHAHAHHHHHEHDKAGAR